MADFKNKPPEWNAKGAEPSSDLKSTGFTAGYKPPATYFNWFWNKVSLCLKELQARSAGWLTQGDEMSPTLDTTATAGSGAEIFNDYRARAYDADGKASAGNVATGNRSHAEGSATTATGNSAHAEGVYSKASGLASHAEGGETTASNYYAHAEGYQTEATASYAHAEGYRAKATEAHSHAEGNGSVSSGASSHAEGLETEASGNAAHSEGQGTKAIARCTHAEGYKTEASKDHAHAEGNECIASGIASHAEGSGTMSTAYYAHAEGGLTTVIGNYSHVEGHSTNKAKTAVADIDEAGLSFTTDNETIKTAWNAQKFALVKGNNAHGEGMNCLALSANSHTEGKETITEGEGAHAEGTLTRAIGNHSHAEGYGTKAVGNFSHAAGYETEAIGEYSTASGTKTTALGKRSIATGYSSAKAKEALNYNLESLPPDEELLEIFYDNPFTLAKGDSSYAGGRDCMALGYSSFAYGEEAVAIGNNSHSEGIGTIANGYQFVLGYCNTAHSGASDIGDQSANSTLFIIGNGKYATTSNALRTTADGQTRGLKSFLASGADFAEYFEWLDGNPDNEDRRGRIVTLEGDKIRFATAEDNYILGVVSTTGAFIGNASSENWQGKYLKDVFGEWLTEEVEIPEKVDEKTGKVIPAHTITRYVTNPDYNAKQDYVSREFRKEWTPVGFHGQLVVVDDGTCQVNGFCKPSGDGVGTASSDGYFVMSRLDDTHIKVLVK